MTEQVENRCLKYCNGACCRNIVFFNVNAKDLALLSKTAERKQTINDVLDIVFQRPAPEGVYFATDIKGINTVGIKGNCPNLLPGGECGIYDVRPDACRNLEVGGQVCKDARKLTGLKPL